MAAQQNLGHINLRQVDIAEMDRTGEMAEAAGELATTVKRGTAEMLEFMAAAAEALRLATEEQVELMAAAAVLVEITTVQVGKQEIGVEKEERRNQMVKMPHNIAGTILGDLLLD